MIDPAEVAPFALQNAAPVAALLLTTDCLKVDQPAPPQAPSPPVAAS